MIRIIVSVLSVLIFSVYSIPVIYEAYIEKQISFVSTIIASDMLKSRRQANENGRSQGLFFYSYEEQGDAYNIFIDSNNNNQFDEPDEILRTVYLKNLSKNVIYAKWFDDTGMRLKNNTIIFYEDGYSSVMNNDKLGANSVFIVYKRDFDKNIKERIGRIFIVPETTDIKLLRVKDVLDSGEIIFMEM